MPEELDINKPGIVSSRTTIDRPVKNATVMVAALFEVRKEYLQVMGTAGLQRAVGGAVVDKVKLQLAKSMGEAYDATGLRKISYNLVGEATKNFNPHVYVYGSRIIVDGVWNTPQIDYFYFQLFGFHGDEQVKEHQRKQWVGEGQSRRLRVSTVRAHVRHVDYAGRPFIKLDTKCRMGLELILNNAIADELMRMKPMGFKREKVSPRKTMAAERPMIYVDTGRPSDVRAATIHQAKRSLRETGMHWAAAKQLIEGAKKLGYQKSELERLVRIARAGMATHTLQAPTITMRGR